MKNKRIKLLRAALLLPLFALTQCDNIEEQISDNLSQTIKNSIEEREYKTSAHLNGKSKSDYNIENNECIRFSFSNDVVNPTDPDFSEHIEYTYSFYKISVYVREPLYKNGRILITSTNSCLPFDIVDAYFSDSRNDNVKNVTEGPITFAFTEDNKTISYDFSDPRINADRDTINVFNIITPNFNLLITDCP